MKLLTPQSRAFARHYLEMVVAMFAGMAVLGLPAEALLRLAGSGMTDLHDTAPAASLLLMAVLMTIPMVALMRYRGHAWRPCWEMSASMFLPTFAAIGLMWADVVTSHAAMTLEHVAMLPAMLVAMLLRRDEYSACHGRRGHAAPAAA